MNDVKKCWVVIVSLAVMGMATISANAQTAQEIADSVIDELDNVTDYTATVDIDYDDEDIDDMTDGSLQWKRNSGTWMTKIVDGTPYTRTNVCNGIVWNGTIDGDDRIFVLTKTDGDEGLRHASGGDMFNMESILDNETWSKDPNTDTINSVSCYRIYTTKGSNNYEVWVDVATMTKVIRVKATDGNDDLQWQLDYSDYSDVESTAMLPATIVTKHYINDVLVLTATYSFADIDINEGLLDSIFTCISSE